MPELIYIRRTIVIGARQPHESSKPSSEIRFEGMSQVAIVGQHLTAESLRKSFLEDPEAI
jgi:hypothetical protein